MIGRAQCAPCIGVPWAHGADVGIVSLSDCLSAPGRASSPSPSQLQAHTARAGRAQLLARIDRAGADPVGFAEVAAASRRLLGRGGSRTPAMRCGASGRAYIRSMHARRPRKASSRGTALAMSSAYAAAKSATVTFSPSRPGRLEVLRSIDPQGAALARPAHAIACKLFPTAARGKPRVPSRLWAGAGT